MSQTPSHFQQAIYDRCPSPSPLIIKARAGSGKTHTGTVCANMLADKEPVFFAFNRHIVEELRRRITDPSITITTIHAHGFAALRKADNVDGRIKVVENKQQKLAIKWLDKNPSVWKGLGFSRAWDCLPSVLELIEFARLTLTNPKDHDTFITAAAQYGLPAPIELVTPLDDLLTQGAALAEDLGEIDFTDMLYLPARWELPVDRFDCVMVDECQDLSPAQFNIVMRSMREGAFGVALGDPAQAIQQFAFAGLRSFDDVQTGMAAEEMPLPICYRCPTSHIELAQQLVPDIQARPDAPVGTITSIKEADLPKQVRPGDMLLCRNTAPLIETCLQLIGNHIRASVRGRDIGKDIGTVINKASKGGIEQLPEDLFAYHEEQAARLKRMRAPDSRLAALSDRVAGALAVHSAIPASSIDELTRKASEIFGDNTGGVVLSTVHRAKGLEADRVFLLHPELFGTDSEAERNVTYVAQTRSKDLLCYVEPKVPMKRRGA